MALSALALAVGLSAGACVSRPAPAPSGVVHVLGVSEVSAATLAAWYRANTPTTYRATVPIATLAEYFVFEGNMERVRGDLAFAQSIVETGWFAFSTSVPPSYNNFAGLGATDGGGAPARFSHARTGVRAQIQHLIAYAAPKARCTVPPLHNPCADARFDLVSPHGKADSWNEMGNGNWATDPEYGSKVIAVYNRIRAYAGLPPV
jgi:Mannosyl-glycoprotein endo-beta-N-acetylglucosaminidase